MKVLINHSNHLSSSWSEEQKKVWDIIIDLPFPNIPPDAETSEILSLVYKNLESVREVVEKYDYNSHIYCYVAGEYTYSYLFVLMLKEKLPINIAIPTTKREVREIKKEDGSIEKISTFKFVRWRTIQL